MCDKSQESEEFGDGEAGLRDDAPWRGPRGDREVAARDQLAAGCSGDCLHGGDHRLRHGDDLLHHGAARRHDVLEIGAAAVVEIILIQVPKNTLRNDSGFYATSAISSSGRQTTANRLIGFSAATRLE